MLHIEKLPEGVYLATSDSTIFYSRSMMVTLAWPPPSHMVCKP